MSPGSEWRIWYTDGTTFSNKDGLPGEAPSAGVQAIAERRGGRTILWIYGDLYAWVGDGWRTAIVRKSTWPDDCLILYGELIDKADFKRMKIEALEWLSLPV